MGFKVQGANITGKKCLPAGLKNIIGNDGVNDVLES
jgi:hypothetical protein